MIESTEDVPKPEETQVVLNIKDLYKIGNEDVSLDIPTTYYSNIAYVQVHSRDVYVDFMQIPGTIKGGTMTINATRIIMPHTAAQRLAVALTESFIKAISIDKIEKFEMTAPAHEEESDEEL